MPASVPLGEREPDRRERHGRRRRYAVADRSARAPPNSSQLDGPASYHARSVLDRGWAVPAELQGYAPFEGSQTWYKVVGDVDQARSGTGPAPLVTIHGGPGATHDYLLSMADLARGGRAVIFYDQTGNGHSTHFPDRGDDFFTVDLFARELANLIGHLQIGARYHILGQSWGGILAQEHMLTDPPGLRSAVLSNTAVSLSVFGDEATGLRAQLPASVQATLRRHEEAGTTGEPEYAEACEVFYARHLCRLDPRPDEVNKTFELLDADPTVYHTTNGPSEFHVIGSFRDWSTLDRLGQIQVPTLVISGRYDEATPRAQEALVHGIGGAEQVILEQSSHMPFWEQRDEYMAAVDDFLRRHD
jgi:L-proline amide hydrolase